MSVRGPVSHKNISNDNFGDEVQKVISARGIEDVGEVRFSDSGFYSVLGTSTLSSDRTIALPNISGTVALTSQIVDPSGFVDLTTDQTITSQKVFDTPPEFPNGIFNNTISFFPDSNGGFLLATKGSYGSYVSQGLSLTGPQTITNGAYLAGSTLNCDNSTYTDSATAASGVVAQVSDVLIGQRTYTASNTGVVYTSAASLRIRGPPVASTNVTITTPNALQVDSGDLRLTNGRVLSTALGTAASPAFAIGTLLNTGIYSSAANNVNISAGGTLRATFSTASLTFANNYGVSCSGTATVTSGSGGFTSAGPVSSSLASSAAACAVRPTNSANTGIFGTASTACNIAVGGTAILSCSTSGASVTGTVSASGVSSLNGGAKIGSIGSTTASLVRGTVSYSTSLSAGGYVGLTAQNFTGSVTFASAPFVICSLQLAAGASFWDQCSVSVVSTSTTQVTFAIKNNSSSATSGTVNICYFAWI
jgi:hypothetical protein